MCTDIARVAGSGHRLVLYTGNPCPWCHRVTLSLAVRSILSVEVVRLDDAPERASRGGWAFARSRPDPLFGASDLLGVYDARSPGYEGRGTAPLLVDATTSSIVSQNSGNIMRIVNALPAESGAADVELVPADLEEEISKWNDMLFDSLCNAVYRCGFATTQHALEADCNARRLVL